MDSGLPQLRFTGSSPRVRIEWNTKETINRRQLAYIQETGSQKITSAMIAEHPTNGAHIMVPINTRKDVGSYKKTDYFPDSPTPFERPKLPPRSLFRNPWLNDFDIESGDVIQELKGVVKEDNRFLTEIVQRGFAKRTWSHHWLTPAETAAIQNRAMRL